MDDTTTFLVIGADSVEFNLGPNKEVLMRLRGVEAEMGLTPGVGLLINMTPTEARRVGEALIRMADRAEEGLPRA